MHDETDEGVSAARTRQSSSTPTVLLRRHPEYPAAYREAIAAAPTYGIRELSELAGLL